MNTSWPLWMQITERCWNLLWRVLGVFLVFAAAPSGLIFGLRLVKLIRPVVAP